MKLFKELKLGLVVAFLFSFSGAMYAADNNLIAQCNVILAKNLSTAQQINVLQDLSKCADAYKAFQTFAASNCIGPLLEGELLLQVGASRGTNQMVCHAFNACGINLDDAIPGACAGVAP